MQACRLICEYAYVVLTAPLILLGIMPVPYGIQTYLENGAQRIDVDSDNICMITQENFQENAAVEQCNQCKIVFSGRALHQWLSTKHATRQCIVCGYPYDWMHFTKGRAHIIPQAVAVPPPV